MEKQRGTVLERWRSSKELEGHGLGGWGVGVGRREGERGWVGSRNVIILRKEKWKLFFNVQSTTTVVSGRKTENYDRKLNTYICEGDKERRFHQFFL